MNREIYNETRPNDDENVNSDSSSLEFFGAGITHSGCAFRAASRKRAHRPPQSVRLVALNALDLFEIIVSSSAIESAAST